MMRTHNPPRPQGETVFNVRCEGSMAAIDRFMDSAYETIGISYGMSYYRSYNDSCHADISG